MCSGPRAEQETPNLGWAFHKLLVLLRAWLLPRTLSCLFLWGRSQSWVFFFKCSSVLRWKGQRGSKSTVGRIWVSSFHITGPVGCRKAAPHSTHQATSKPMGGTTQGNRPVHPPIRSHPLGGSAPYPALYQAQKGDEQVG